MAYALDSITTQSRRNSDASFVRQPRPTNTQGSSTVRKQFAESIRAFANRLKESFYFSGEHYVFLASFLDQTPNNSKYIPPEPRFKSVYVKVQHEDRTKNQLNEYDAWDGHATFQALRPPDTHTSHLVFIRGWQSKEWLRVLGAQYSIDPEVFRRHLIFLNTRHFYDLPGLPSASRQICQLRVSTIVERQVALSQAEVRETRKADEDAVKQYLSELRDKRSPGVSIIRRYAVHNETRSTIEQTISLSSYQRSDGGWVGIAWLDNGKRLSDGIPGPWLEETGSAGDSYNPYVPVIQHKAKIAFLVPQDEDVASQPMLPSSSRNNPGGHSQSACMLPVQYGSLLDQDMMRSDALYAFSDLFSFAASSENQFLGLVQGEIETAIRSFHGQEQWCLENLRYSKVLLDEHAEHIEQVLLFLKAEENTNWPQVKDPQKIPLRNATRKTLTDDFSHLLSRTNKLANRAMNGTHSILNDAMLKESQNAISHAREVGRLSLLAYFFLPLSFASSLFGMNFVQISSLGWAAGSAVIVFLTVSIISAVLCFWEIIPWKRLMVANSSLKL